MRKKIIAVIALLLIITAAYVFFNQQQSPQSGNTLTLFGNIDIREVQLKVNASEHIAGIFAEEGDRVKKGQLLAKIDARLLQAKLAEAQANLVVQQQIVARLHAGNRPQDIKKARADYAAAKAEARAAKDTAHRLEKLLPQKQASADDVETARAKAEAAKARADAVAETLALSIAGPRKEDIAVAEAQLKARQAGVQLAKQQLDDANLYSPANGIIRNRILEPGDMVSPQSAIFTLSLVDPVWARAYVPETSLGKIAAGFDAEIISDSYPGKRYRGWVGYISPTAEFTPKNVQTAELRTRLVYSVRVYACNANNELRLGMPVTVKIPLHQQAGTTTHHCDDTE